jgi:hypothetical protein
MAIWMADNNRRIKHVQNYGLNVIGNVEFLFIRYAQEIPAVDFTSFCSPRLPTCGVSLNPICKLQLTFA